MKRFQVVPFLVFMSLANQAFAVCEQERNELADWNSRCEDLTAAANAAGTAGGFCAFFTFGTSLIPFTVAAFAADNACRIRDEKKNNLNRCEGVAAEEVRRADALARQAAARVELERLKAELAPLYREQDERNIGYRTTHLNRLCAEEIQQFTDGLVAEGWDMNDPDVIHLIRDTRADLEAKRDRALTEFITNVREAATRPVQNIFWGPTHE